MNIHYHILDYCCLPTLTIMLSPSGIYEERGTLAMGNVIRLIGATLNNNMARVGVNTINENDSWGVLISIPWLKCLNDLDVCLFRSRFCPWCWHAPQHPGLAHPIVAMNADCVALVSPTRARWTDTVFYINPISQAIHAVYATKCTPEGTVWNGTCTWCTSQTKNILNNTLVCRCWSKIACSGISHCVDCRVDQNITRLCMSGTII